MSAFPRRRRQGAAGSGAVPVTRGTPRWIRRAVVVVVAVSSRRAASVFFLAFREVGGWERFGEEWAALPTQLAASGATRSATNRN